jgi:serine/threonine protein phosphatase 1
MFKYAVSDIHGCHRTFSALLDRIALSTADKLFLLGDYIDRGPASRQVLDMMLELRAGGYQVRCIKGNHEDAMLLSRYDGTLAQAWYHQWGGRETIRSFGVSDLSMIPTAYLSMLETMPLYLEAEPYILVHAGLGFRGGDPLAGYHDMLYLRDWHAETDRDWLGNRIVLHGHTPVTKSEIERQLRVLEDAQVLDIDAGCFQKGRPGYGHLCAFEMTGRRLFFQENIE